MLTDYLKADKTKKMPVKSLFFLLIAIMVSTAATAQPFTLDKKVQPLLLELVSFKTSDSLRNGKRNITRVVQVKDTSYYYVKGLSIYQPIVLHISSADANNKMIIHVTKDIGKKPDRIGSLNTKGIWQAAFET